MPKMRTVKVKKSERLMWAIQMRERFLADHRANTIDYTGCTFANGDKATGYYQVEDGKVWFTALDNQGREYQTEEQPAMRLNLTLIRLQDGITEAEAKRIIAEIKADLAADDNG